MRVVTVPNDAGRLPGNAEVGHPLPHIAARAGARRARRVGERVAVADPFGGRELGIDGRHRIDQQHGGGALADEIRDVPHFVGLQRRRQRDEQGVELRLDGLLRIDRVHLILLAQLLHDRPGRIEPVLLVVDAAHQIHHRPHDANPLALRAGHDADAADHFVLGREPAVEERDHLLLGAARERQSHEDLGDVGPRRPHVTKRARPDPERLACVARGVGERFRVVDLHLHACAGKRVDLVQHAEQVRAGLNQRLRHFRADVRLDEHRTVSGQIPDQPPRFPAQ